ncbi:hypothetical protein HYC85_022557, partial [Camellia sinensis]
LFKEEEEEEEDDDEDEQVFDVFDERKNGVIEFDEFVHALNVKQMLTAIMMESDVKLTDELVEAIIDKVQCGDVELEKKIDEKIGQFIDKVEKHLSKKIDENIVCDGLSNILFSSNSIKGMQNLELLDVQWCPSIGVAFDLEGLLWKGISDMALPSLKKDNSPGIQGFQNLRSLKVNGCGSLINLLSYTLAKLLVKLQDIEVTECGGMEAIIANEPNANDEVIIKIIMFPQLKKLKFRNLPNLESFCSRTYKFEESLLKTVEVSKCPKLKTLPPAF